MWEIIREQRVTEDNVRYNAYGLRRGECRIPDICADSKEIARFAELFNKYDVSTVNAIDVIEDLLAEA
ncbi:MAG: hypothetical protein ACI4XA_03045 [Oscillospiraceae bacterium]